jgi:hypothetical protein
MLLALLHIEHALPDTNYSPSGIRHADADRNTCPVAEPNANTNATVGADADSDSNRGIVSDANANPHARLSTDADSDSAPASHAEQHDAG